MLDIEKLKKTQTLSRRMHLLNYICGKIEIDLYYLFGLLNMYNVKNSGRWFWQKAAFGGVLKEDFDKFNSYMDKFSARIKSYDRSMVESSLDEAQVLLEKLLRNLETNLVVDRQIDGVTVRGYVDNNIRSIISQNLRNL